MDEHVIALLPTYEAKALLSVEELYCACSQLISLFRIKEGVHATPSFDPLTSEFEGPTCGSDLELFFK